MSPLTLGKCFHPISRLDGIFLTRCHRLFIGGEWVDPADGEYIELVLIIDSLDCIFYSSKVSLILVTSLFFSLLSNTLTSSLRSHGKTYHQRCCGKQKRCWFSRRCSQESERQGFTIGYLSTERLFFSQAFKTTWGLHCPGVVRGKLLYKLADLIEEHIDEFAALEALDVGMCRLFSCWIRYNCYTASTR